MKVILLLPLLWVFCLANAAADELLGVIDEVDNPIVQGDGRSIVIDGKQYKLPEKMLVQVSGHDSIPITYLKMGLNVLFTLGEDSEGSTNIDRMEVIGPAADVRKHFLESHGL